MKEYNHFFGADVSKKTVDITHAFNQQFTHRQFTNDDGMKELMSWLEEINPDFASTLFCI